MTTYDVEGYRAAFQLYLQNPNQYAEPQWYQFIIATPTGGAPQGGSAAIPAPHVEPITTGSDQLPPPSVQDPNASKNKTKIETVDQTKVSFVPSNAFGGESGTYGNAVDTVVPAAKLDNGVTEKIVSPVEPINAIGEFVNAKNIDKEQVQPSTTTTTQPTTTQAKTITAQEAIQKNTDLINQIVSNAKLDKASSIQAISDGKVVSTFIVDQNTKDTILGDIPRLQNLYGANLSLVYTGQPKETTQTVTSSNNQAISEANNNSLLQAISGAKAAGAKSIDIIANGKQVDSFTVNDSLQTNLTEALPALEKEYGNFTLSFKGAAVTQPTVSKIPLTQEQIQANRDYVDQVSKIYSDAKAAGAQSIVATVNGKQIDTFRIDDNTKSVLFESLPNLQKNYGDVQLSFKGQGVTTETTQKIPLTQEQVDTIHKNTENVVQTVLQAKSAGAHQILLTDEKGNTLETVPVNDETTRTLFLDIPNLQKSGKQVFVSFTPELKTPQGESVNLSYEQLKNVYSAGKTEFSPLTDIIIGTEKGSKALADTGKAALDYITSFGKVNNFGKIESDVISETIGSPLKTTVDQSGKQSTTISVQNAQENLGNVGEQLKNDPYREIGKTIPTVAVSLLPIGEFAGASKAGLTAAKDFVTSGGIKAAEKIASDVFTKEIVSVGASGEKIVTRTPVVNYLVEKTDIPNVYRLSIGTGNDEVATGAKLIDEKGIIPTYEGNLIKPEVVEPVPAKPSYISAGLIDLNKNTVHLFTGDTEAIKTIPTNVLGTGKLSESELAAIHAEPINPTAFEFATKQNSELLAKDLTQSDTSLVKNPKQVIDESNVVLPQSEYVHPITLERINNAIEAGAAKETGTGITFNLNDFQKYPDQFREFILTGERKNIVLPEAIGTTKLISVESFGAGASKGLGQGGVDEIITNPLEFAKKVETSKLSLGERIKQNFSNIKYVIKNRKTFNNEPEPIGGKQFEDFLKSSGIESPIKEENIIEGSNVASSGSTAKTVQQQLKDITTFDQPKETELNFANPLGLETVKPSSGETKTETKANQKNLEYIESLSRTRKNLRSIYSDQDILFVSPKISNAAPKTKTTTRTNEILDQQISDILNVQKQDNSEKSGFKLVPIESSKTIEKGLTDFVTQSKQIIDVEQNKKTTSIIDVSQEIVSIETTKGGTINIPTFTQIEKQFQITPEITKTVTTEIPTGGKTDLVEGGGFFGSNFVPPIGSTGRDENPQGNKKTLYADFDISDIPLGISEVGKVTYSEFGNTYTTPKKSKVSTKTPTPKGVKLPKYKGFKNMFTTKQKKKSK